MLCLRRRLGRAALSCGLFSACMHLPTALLAHTAHALEGEIGCANARSDVRARGHRWGRGARAAVVLQRATHDAVMVGVATGVAAALGGAVLAMLPETWQTEAGEAQGTEGGRTLDSTMRVTRQLGYLLYAASLGESAWACWEAWQRRTRSSNRNDGSNDENSRCEQR